MDKKLCHECKFYLQHYTFSKHKLVSVYCGHCTLGSPRRKRPDTKACESFVPSPDPRDLFVTKEYLTKELLQHVLNMELLPEITVSE